MSGGGTTQNTTQNTVQQVQLPPWVNQAAQQNYAFAQNVANRPLQQYQGQMVADVAPATQEAWNLMQSSGQAGQPQYQESEAGYLGAMGAGAPQVTPGMLANTNLSPYMNPYTQSVIDATTGQMNRNLQQQQMQTAGQAVQSGAFGGSRMGVQQGVNQAQTNLGIGQMAAQLNNQNFTQAQTAATNDLQRQLAAAQGNQQAVIAGNQNNIAAATGLQNLGNAAQRNVLQQFMGLGEAGVQQQTQAQNEINAQMQKFGQAWNYPTTQLNTLLSSLGMTPYGQTTTGTSQGTTTTQQATDPFAMGLGALSTLGGLFSAPAGGMSAASGIMGMFSDERSKTDIQHVGKDGGTGLDMYAFRYKGDPKTYPKVVGPMAQDVERKIPSAVTKVGKRKVINPATLNAGVMASHRVPRMPGVPTGMLSIA